MEHINENMIRVVIQNEDLVARGITFLDLLGNRREIENFFYSILEEVDIEEEFQGSDAITFQVMPKGDGLELYISKSMPGEDVNGLEIDEQFRDDISEFFRRQSGSVEPIEDLSSYEHLNSLVFQLESFEDMILLAQEVHLDTPWSNLYRYEGHYFLQIIFLQEDMTDEQRSDEVAQLLEFADLSPVTSETLGEHGEIIMERTAIEQTQRYFR